MAVEGRLGASGILLDEAEESENVERVRSDDEEDCGGVSGKGVFSPVSEETGGRCEYIR